MVVPADHNIEWVDKTTSVDFSIKLMMTSLERKIIRQNPTPFYVEHSSKGKFPYYEEREGIF